MGTWTSKNPCKNCGKTGRPMVKCTNCGTLGCTYCVGQPANRTTCKVCKKSTKIVKV